jgi:putative FmdB family regulatory protein
VPTYQYACTACDERLEVVQKFSDEPLTVCPACSSRLRKVFSPVGVVFKGSGFYRTDSRKETAGAKTGSGGGSAGESGGSSGSSSGSKDAGSSTGDSKPAAKSDSGSAKKSSETKVA